MASICTPETSFSTTPVVANSSIICLRILNNILPGMDNIRPSTKGSGTCSTSLMVLSMASDKRSGSSLIHAAMASIKSMDSPSSMVAVNSAVPIRPSPATPRLKLEAVSKL